MKDIRKPSGQQTSLESSKIAAFLPARQLWTWAGKGFKRSTGRVKKQFFKSIQRGKETISVNYYKEILLQTFFNLVFIVRLVIVLYFYQRDDQTDLILDTLNQCGKQQQITWSSVSNGFTIQKRQKVLQT